MNTAQERLDAVSSSVEKLRNFRQFLQTEKEAAEKVVEEEKYKVDLYQRSSEIFKNWLEDSVRENIDSMAELATSGLQHVIYDQNLTFKVHQESKYNRIAMKFILNDDGVEGDPLNSFGGGPAVLISLILRLAVMARLQMGKLLILDESMASLANHYVPNAADFMRQLAEETGINILMVTHNNEFTQRAHLAYEGTKDGHLKLRKVQSS